MVVWVAKCVTGVMNNIFNIRFCVSASQESNRFCLFGNWNGVLF